MCDESCHLLQVESVGFVKLIELVTIDIQYAYHLSFLDKRHNNL